MRFCQSGVGLVVQQLNAAVWIGKADVPRDGIASTVTEDDLGKNLDPKGPRKK